MPRRRRPPVVFFRRRQEAPPISITRPEGFSREPLYMDDEDWARSLDSCQTGLEFERALDNYREHLYLNAEENDYSEYNLVGKDQEVLMKDQQLIFSPGDKRIWHQRVEHLVDPCLSLPASDDNQEKHDSVETTQLAAKVRVDLVEALFGHGLLRDYDLPILSPIESEESNSDAFGFSFTEATIETDDSLAQQLQQDLHTNLWAEESITPLEELKERLLPGLELVNLSQLMNIESPLDQIHNEDEISRLMNTESPLDQIYQEDKMSRL